MGTQVPLRKQYKCILEHIDSLLLRRSSDHRLFLDTPEDLLDIVRKCVQGALDLFLRAGVGVLEFLLRELVDDVGCSVPDLLSAIAMNVVHVCRA
jgi:hypothetical protein